MKTSKNEKIICKNMPIDISMEEYLIVAKTLYASFSTMCSENKCFRFISLIDKKVYMFDSINESEKVKEFSESSDYALLNVI